MKATKPSARRLQAIAALRGRLGASGASIEAQLLSGQLVYFPGNATLDALARTANAETEKDALRSAPTSPVQIALVAHLASGVVAEIVRRDAEPFDMILLASDKADESVLAVALDRLNDLRRRDGVVIEAVEQKFPVNGSDVIALRVQPRHQRILESLRSAGVVDIPGVGRVPAVQTMVKNR